MNEQRGCVAKKNDNRKKKLLTFSKAKPRVGDGIKTSHGGDLETRQQRVEAVVLKCQRRPASQVGLARAQLQVET